MEVEPQLTYGKGIKFDFAAGDFVLDGAGRLVIVDGHTEWVQWCIKTVLTERFAYLVYGPDYGTELEALPREPSRGAAEARVRRTITEALMVNPRTREVRGFDFRWEGNVLHVSFEVVPTVGRPERLEVSVSV